MKQLEVSGFTSQCIKKQAKYFQYLLQLEAKGREHDSIVDMGQVKFLPLQIPTLSHFAECLTHILKALFLHLRCTIILHLRRLTFIPLPGKLWGHEFEIWKYPIAEN